jgi:hypothetical protein
MSHWIRGNCLALVAMFCMTTGVWADGLWVVHKANVGLRLDPQALEHLDLAVPGNDRSGRAPLARFEMIVSPSSEISFLIAQGRVKDLLFDRIDLGESLRITRDLRQSHISDLLLVDNDGSESTVRISPNTLGTHWGALLLSGVRASFHKPSRTFTMHSESVLISKGLAEILGDSQLEGARIGSMVLQGTAKFADGVQAEAEVEWGGDDRLPLDVMAASAPDGGDVTFCELYDLRQFGRVGSVVGLAVATTSWNVGTKDVPWFALPDETHPFIGQNLYRLKDDRFEQIGQSWVKHGFFALSNTQCGGTCTFESGHSGGNWLGQGCTDTYSSSLNASQSSLGPRFEINPWNGDYNYATSLMNPNNNPPSNDGITRRLQVHDDDLNPALNSGATYYVEGYYVVAGDEDVFHLNNAAWKQVTPNGSPGGTWNFSMSGFSTPPNIGFAADAWLGAQETVIAQEFPVIEKQSRDGRSVLYAKAKEVGSGVYRYEYALLNVDMDRKVGSFRVPFRPGTNISNVGFYAVKSHGEPYSNDPWTAAVSSNAVEWSTVDNPIRWGTLFNFRFDADVPPFDTTITVGLFDPGDPTSLNAVSTGPDPRDANCDVVESPVAADPSMVINRYIAVEGGQAGESTALRVRLSALLRDPDSGVASSQASQFEQFEGEVRWVGPPATYDDGMGGTFQASALQCTPHFIDWSAVGPVYIHGSEILPDSTYEVQALHEACGAILTDESKYSPAASIETAHWGDVAAPFGTLEDANGQPNFADVSAILDTFRGSVGSIGTARAQLQPNEPDPSSNVNFADVSTGVDSFRGFGYPFSGPTSCP